MCGRASLVEKGLNCPFAAPNSVGRVDKGTLTFLLDDSHNHPVGTPFLWDANPQVPSTHSSSRVWMRHRPMGVVSPPSLLILHSLRFKDIMITSQYTLKARENNHESVTN